MSLPQLCCAHALRELAAVTEAAAPGEWSWADQAADALIALQKLVAEVITTVAAVKPDPLTEQLRLYRSAGQIGLTHTAARSDALMRKHHALARRLADRQDDCLRFITNWRIPLLTGYREAP